METRRARERRRSSSFARANASRRTSRRAWAWDFNLTGRHVRGGSFDQSQLKEHPKLEAPTFKTGGELPRGTRDDVLLNRR